MDTIGIIMAGGKGIRLSPITKIINKHLIPVYNKPMIFYPLSLLIYSGIKKIIIITNPDDKISIKKILEPIIKKYNLKIFYKIQNNIGGGIAEGLLLAKDEIIKKNKKKFVLILGDNFFFGKEFPKTLRDYLEKKDKNSYIFLSEVSNPKEYGIAYLNRGKINKIIEKPKNLKSKLAVTGLYVYDKNVLNFIDKIKPSKRNELEITSINNFLIKKKKLGFFNLGRGTAWFDLGTFENIFACSEYVRLLENRQGLKISNI